MEKVEIRPICSRDTELISELYKQFEVYGYALGNAKELFIKSIYEYLKKKNLKDEYFCIILENAKIGFIKTNIIKDSKVLWINSFLIIQEWQNRGFGTKALKVLEDFYVERFNIKYIYVSVVFKNVKGVEFWNNNNYRTIKVVEKKVESGRTLEEIIVMRKII